MNNNHQSIQLVYKDEATGHLVINEESLNEFKKIKGNIGLCVIFGPVKEGKSYLLNRLICDKSSPFMLTTSDNIRTKGVWINQIPIKTNHNNEEVNIVFVDTEGFESKQTPDDKLFLFLFSISSMILYNSKDTLTNEEFSKLSGLKKILNINNSNPDKKHNVKENPDFAWIIRDYSLMQQIEPNERLKRFLELEKEDGPDKVKCLIRERNDIRKSIMNSFSSINCFYLSKPDSSGKTGKSLDAKDLQNLHLIELDKLSDKFQKGIKDLREFVLKNTKPKVINKQKLNGVIFAEYIKSIINLINNDDLVNLQETLTASIENAAWAISEQAKNHYVQHMDSLLKDRATPMKWPDFKVNEEKINKECVEIIKSNITTSDSVCKYYLNKYNTFREEKQFERPAAGKLIEYKKANEKLITDFNERIMKEIKQTYSDEMKKYMSKNGPTKWTDFNDNEKIIAQHCILKINEKLIPDEKNSFSKYLNDFHVFKEKKSYNGHLTGGKLHEFYVENEKSINEKNRANALDLWSHMNMKREFTSESLYKISIDDYKNKLKLELFECSDFSSFWDKIHKEFDIETTQSKIKTKKEAKLKLRRTPTPVVKKTFKCEKCQFETEDHNELSKHRDKHHIS